MFLFPPLTLETGDYWVYLLIYLIGIPVALFAFIHALSQRADAFTAADRLTKGKWLGITGGGAAAMLLGGIGLLIFWVAGLVAVLVYIVDVRPAVIEVQGGPRW